MKNIFKIDNKFYIVDPEGEIEKGDHVICNLDGWTYSSDLKPIRRNTYLKFSLGKILEVHSDDENEEEDYYLIKDNTETCRWDKDCALKIVLTTDVDLIDDGVQSIDGASIKWLINNPNYAHVDIKKEVISFSCSGCGGYYDLFSFDHINCIPCYVKNDYKNTVSPKPDKIEFKIIIPKEEHTEEFYINIFTDDTKQQCEKKYSEEEVKDIVEKTIDKFYKSYPRLSIDAIQKQKDEWFEQFKKK